MLKKKGKKFLCGIAAVIAAISVSGTAMFAGEELPSVKEKSYTLSGTIDLNGGGAPALPYSLKPGNVFEGESYYTQLDDISKDFYELFYNSYKDGGHGNRVDILPTLKKYNKAEYKEEDETAMTTEIHSHVYSAFLTLAADHPELSWISRTTYGITMSAMSIDGTVTLVSVDFAVESGYKYGTAAEINSAVDNAKKEIGTEESRYELVKAIHDYICNITDYNHTAVSDSKPANYDIGWYQTAYSAFYPISSNKETEIRTVCAGYSTAFKVLCDSYGIPCVTVRGTANTGENHMWNYVKMENGEWYAVDTTWDDQTENVGKIYYDNFLVGGNTATDGGLTFSERHINLSYWETQNRYLFAYPELADEKYEPVSDPDPKPDPEPDENQADYEYEENEDGTITITKYKGEGGDVVIPSEIGGKKVTGIGNQAFGSCVTLTSVTIPNGVKEIAGYAFYDCYFLNSVDLPESLKSIGSCAFFYCALTSVDIPASVTNIDSNAFRANQSLTTVNVDEKNESYTSVDGILFSKDMTELVCYPAGKTNESYAIPNTVKLIAGSAFSFNVFLTSVEIPDSVIEISEQAFYNSTLISVKIPASVTSIGISAFSECSKMSSINVDEKNASYSSIDGVLFNKNQTKLMQYPALKDGEKYIVPDNVTRIDEFAFSLCNLVSVELPATLEYIAGTAFENCPSLVDFIVNEANKNYAAVDGLLYNKDKTILLQYTLGKKIDSYTIPSGTKIIGEYAFHLCSLKSVIIPEGVTTLEGSAFNLCFSLAAVVIPDSVTSIGSYAFRTYSPLVIYGNTGSYAESFAKENNIPFISAGYTDQTQIDTSTGIVVSAEGIEGATLEGVSLEVEKGESGETKVVFNITLTDEERNEVQPEKPVTVSIPVPADWDSSLVKVFRREENGQYTNMEAEYKNGRMVFITDHFSEYVITTEVIVPDILLGDVDGNNTVNTSDALMAIRAFFKKIELTPAQFTAADVDGNGKVDTNDALLMIRIFFGKI